MKTPNDATRWAFLEGLESEIVIPMDLFERFHPTTASSFRPSATFWRRRKEETKVIPVNMHGVPAGLEKTVEFLEQQQETPAQRILEGFERALQDAVAIKTLFF